MVIKMKYSFDKIKQVTTISIFTILVVSIGLLLFLLSYSSSQLHTTAEHTVNESITYHQATLNDEFKTISNYVLSLANSVSEYQVDSTKVHYFLQDQNEIFNFENIYFIDIDGTVVSATAVEANLQNDFSINTANTTDSTLVTISEPYISEVSGCQLLGLHVPIIYNGRMIGAVYAEYSLAPILDRLSTTVYADGFAFIATNSGTPLASTSTNATPNYSLSHKAFKSITYTDNAVYRMVTHAPLNINNWSLVLDVNEYQLTQDIRTLSTVLTIFVMGLFAGFWFFLLHLWRGRKKLENAAYYDELTGLPNLTKLKLDMSNVLSHHTNEKYVTVKMDISNFKAINEIFGFSVGDKVLQAFYHTSVIVPEKSFILARVGDDEFIMFAGNNFLEQLDSITDHYESYLKQLIPELEHHYLTFNYGRYFIEPDETDVNQIITKTSIAHHAAKENHSGGIWDYDAKYKEQLLYLTELTNKMDSALEHGEFVPFLQPKFRLTDNALIGAEALVRWIHKDGSMVFPNEFIPLFESNGFILKLDKHILESICRTIRSWIDASYNCIPVSVNFSRVHFTNPKFVEEILRIVDRYEIAHNLIEIEVTETTLLDKEEAMATHLVNLRDSGFSVSIDDFGSGYSSLGMLKDFQVDTLKLDRSFFVSETQSEHVDRVVDGVIKLGHSINMNVVAEGVENQAQVEFLKDMNCESAQGYFFAKPMSIAEFNTRYIENT